MQLSNDTSKNSTSPPYFVKNERSLVFDVLLQKSSLSIQRQICNLSLDGDWGGGDTKVFCFLC